MDLFNVIVNPEELHHNFKILLRSEYRYIRKQINSWAEGFVDRDGKIIKEFQTTFNSTFWELYIYAVLKEMGLSIDFNYNSPDYVIKIDNDISYSIECTIASNSIYEKPEENIEERFNPSNSLQDRIDYSTIRISNSLCSKNTWINNNLNIKPEIFNNPFFIAISPFEQANFQDANLQAIRRVLYMHDKVEIYENGDIDLFYKSIIHKNNGAPIELGIFQKDEYKYITGVFFSCVATTSKASAVNRYDTDIMYFHKRYNENSTKSIIGLNTRINDDNMNDYNKVSSFFSEIGNKIKATFSDDSMILRDPFVIRGYTETLSDGLHLFLNPKAKNKLSNAQIDEFYNSGINVVYIDNDNIDQEIYKIHDNYLIYRKVYRAT